ncbi:MAG: fibronectin type III domain-containing protein, partial [bacterium]|nr:fibronectin type III domain-containing protein [bacterium]
NIGMGTPTSMGLGGGVATPTDSAPQFTIVNRSQITLVSFDQTAYTATEAAGAGRTVQVRVNYTPEALIGLTVPFTVTGTATEGSGKDYTRTGGASFTPAAGDSDSTLTVTVLDDAFDDEAETIVITLSDGTNWDLGANPSTTITITDDDAPPEVTLSASPATVAEFAGATQVTVTATLQGTTRFEAAVTLTVNIAGSGGANVVGFTAPASVALPIAAGAASGTATFTLTPTDDEVIESNEVITLSATETGAVINSSTIDLTDDDSATSLSLTLSTTAGEVTEGGAGAAGYKDVTITLGRALTGSETVTVPLTVTGVTVSTDYTFALQPATQTGVTLLTSAPHSAQNPAVRLAAGATSAVLRFTPQDNDDRTNPAAVIAYGTGTRLPSGTGVSLGTPAGSPLIFAVTDDETGALNVASNWALKPAGVGPGQPFRLLYVLCRTDRDATSTDIRAYNTYAWQSHLAHGHDSLDPYAGLLRIVGSTAAVDARVNTGMWSGGAYTDGSTAQNSSGILIYWMGGNDRIANNYFDFYDGRWVGDTDAGQTNFDRCQTGNGRGGNAFIWTGSNADGTGNDGHELGTSQVQYAALSPLSRPGRTPLSRSDQKNAATLMRNFYVLSPVFTAAAETQFAQAAQSVEEDAGTVNVTVNVSPAAGGAITLNYTLSGTATRGTDYAITGVTGDSATVTVPVGATSVNIPVAVTDDSDREGAETVILTLNPGDGYTLGAVAAHTLTIAVNDQSTVTANADGSYTLAGDSPLIPSALRVAGQKFRLMFRTTSRWAATATDIATYDGYVQGEVAGGSLNAMHPYASLFKVVGSTSAAALRDHLDMRDGSNWRPNIPIYWMDASGGGALIADDYQDFCTRDSTHNTNPRERWWKNDDLADQRDEDGTGHGDNNFPFTGSNNDCTKQSTKHLGGSGQVEVGGHADARVWGPLSTAGQTRTNTNSLFAMSPVFKVGAQGLLVASFAQTSQGANEDAGTVNVTVNLSEAQATAVTVSYTLSGTAVRGADYSIAGVTSSSGTIDVPAQATSVNIPVAITDDSAEEAAETIVLTLTVPSDNRYALDTASSVHTLTIGPSDQPGATPVASLGSASRRTAEGAGSVTMTMTVWPAPAAPLLVEYTVTGDALALYGTLPDATPGADLPASGSVTVPVGANLVHFTVPITDDDHAEGAEAALLTLVDRAAYDLGENHVSQIIIDDNDKKGFVFDSAAVTVAEGADADYTVKLATEPTATVTVAISGAGLTAAPASLTFTGGTNGTWDTPQTVTVTAAEDDTDTADDVLALTHTPSGGGYSAPDSGDLRVAVADNDELAVRVVESGGATRPAEPSGTDTYTLALGKQPARAVMITVRSTAPGAAEVSTDGSHFSSLLTVTFGPSTWNRPQTITVRAVDDIFANPDDRRAAEITHRVRTLDAEFRGLTADAVTAQVTDDEPDPVLTLHASTARVGEGETATLTARLASALRGTVSVPLDITRYSAEAGDFSVPSSVRIGARTLEGSVTLRTRHDSDSDHESFDVDIDDDRLPAGVGTAQPSFVSMRIIDDEYVPPPATLNCDTADGYCEAGPLSVGEGKWRQLYTTLTRRPAHFVTGHISVTRGAADVSASSVVTFGPNFYQDRNWAVHGLEDVATRALDPVEITVRFESRDPFFNGKETTLRFQVVDNDGRTKLSLAPGAATLTEADSGTVRLTVTADRPVPVDVTPVLSLRAATVGGDFSGADADCAGCLSADGTKITFPTMRTGATVSQVVLHSKDDNVVERDVLVRGRLELLDAPGGSPLVPPPIVTIDTANHAVALTHTDDDPLTARVHRYDSGDHLFLNRKTEFPISVHHLRTDPAQTVREDYPPAERTADGAVRGTLIPLRAALNLYRGIVLELPEGFPLTGDRITLGDGVEAVDLRAEVPAATAKPLVAYSPVEEVPADILHLNPGAPAADRINMLTVYDITATGFTVAWNAAEGADGYEVRWQAAGQTQPQTARVAGTSHTVSGLTAATDHQVRVMVVKQGSAVAAKSSQTVTVTTADPPPPGTPEVSVTAGAGVTEGAAAVFTVTAAPAPSAPLAVSVTVTQRGDYGVSTGSKTVMVPTGGSAQY